jgi:SAM-dependent methyltransferase
MRREAIALLFLFSIFAFLFSLSPPQRPLRLCVILSSFPFVFARLRSTISPMPGTVDLYNNAYAHYGDDVYREVRVETYGQDLGQTGWTTTDESDKIPRTLGLTSASEALEIGCGSGRYALQIAATIGCRILGVDVNEPGIHNANRLAAQQDLAARARFQIADCAKPLPFADSGFDAAFSNDVLCHIPSRLALFRELLRVLKPGVRFLFSDALIIGGIITHQEIAVRSSIGYYLFSPPGENERLLEQAGFRVLSVVDTTPNAAAISQRWREARQKRSEALAAIEGPKNFDGLQQFLSTVHNLTSERRLLRLLYVAERPS